MRELYPASSRFPAMLEPRLPTPIDQTDFFGVWYFSTRCAKVGHRGYEGYDTGRRSSVTQTANSTAMRIQTSALDRA